MLLNDCVQLHDDVSAARIRNGDFLSARRTAAVRDPQEVVYVPVREPCNCETGVWSQDNICVRTPHIVPLPSARSSAAQPRHSPCYRRGTRMGVM